MLSIFVTGHRYDFLLNLIATAYVRILKRITGSKSSGFSLIGLFLSLMQTVNSNCIRNAST